MNKIFLPEKIKVGFQKRMNTYTNKLAYIIYYDEKGTLRKEKSWEKWRDSSITPKEFDNKPTEGFVLNKKAGGDNSGWNHRNTYCRVYDPRGFEFEISIENLLYILQNVNCMKGKGLEGEFVYGWSGTELILIPTNSPDYKQIQSFTNNLKTAKKFKSKDLIPGKIYITKQQEEIVYLGKFFEANGFKKEQKRYFFKDKNKEYITITSSLNFLTNESEDPIDNNLPIYLTNLKNNQRYSERDQKKDKYVKYENLEKVIEHFENANYYEEGIFFIKKENSFEPAKIEERNISWGYLINKPEYFYELILLKNYYSYYRDRKIECRKKTLEELFNSIELYKLVTYDSNGKKIKEF